MTSLAPLPTWPPPPPRPADRPARVPPRSPLRDAARGALAGFVGTLALRPAMQLGQTLAPGATPPMRQDPGKFVVEKARETAGVQALPRQTEQAAVAASRFGYGMTMGALYGLARLARGGTLAPGGPLAEGVLLGLAVWGVGYLGWLPAVGLMPPVTEQRPAQVAGPILSHVVYGVVTAGTYHAMRRLLGRTP